MELKQKKHILIGCGVFVLVMVIVLIVMASIGVFDSNIDPKTVPPAPAPAPEPVPPELPSPAPAPARTDAGKLTYTIQLGTKTYNFYLLAKDFRKTADGKFFKWDWCSLYYALQGVPRYEKDIDFEDERFEDLRESIQLNIRPLPFDTNRISAENPTGVDYSKIVTEKAKFSISGSELSSKMLVMGTDSCDGTGNVNFEVLIPTLPTKFASYYTIIFTKEQFTDLGYEVTDIDVNLNPFEHEP